MPEHIEREALLHRFNIDDMMNVNGTLISLNDARNVISNVPSVDVAPVSWISVNDMLPDVNRTKSGYESIYVIATNGKRVWTMIYERACVKTEMKFRWKYVWDRIYDQNDIIAWMPLPEPPKMDGAG